MATLISIFPEPDRLLDLPIEGLAEVVLRLADEHKQNGHIHPQALLQQVHGTPGMSDGYPQNIKPAVELAFGEAWNWLTVQGLLIPEPGTNGSNGWMMFGRRAAGLLDHQAFEAFAQSIAFQKSMLHPSIATPVWLELASGDYDSAVFKAFKAVEIAVRKAGGFAAEDIGTKLMHKAFNAENGPLSDMDQPEAERLAVAQIGRASCRERV